jgi:DNA-directed RNA polymerase specialized sigma24 family protein
MKPGGSASASTPAVPVTPDPAPRPRSGMPACELEVLLGDVFAAFHEDAIAYCRRLLGSTDLVEDAIQNAFTELLRRIRAGDAAFFEASPWDAVKRNLRWAALKLRREVGVGEKWFSPLDDARHPVDEHWAAIEGQVMVGGILDRLPSHMRQVLRLRVLEDEPDAISAAVLGISLDAFRCRYKRALGAARSAAQRLGIESAAAVLVIPRVALARRLRSAGAHLSAGAARIGSAVDAGLRLLTMQAVEVVGVATIALVAAAATPATHLTPSAGDRSLAGATTIPVEAGRAAAPVSAPADRASEARVAAPESTGTTIPIVGLHATVPGVQASQETPSDSHLYTATPAPSKSNWIVALGWGQSCSCTVVFQSADRGATWTAAPGPALDSGTGAQVSLPPSYPDDPRIFVSGPAQLNTPSYVADRFGDPFLPLAVPNGSIAVAPTFDRGDDRIFVAGQSAIWTYQVATHLLQPVLTDQPITQVYAAASPGTGAPLLFLVGATTSVATGTSTTTLFACATPTACTTVSTLPLPVANGLAISPTYAADHTIAVSWLNGLALSTDGGRSFAVAGLPTGFHSAATPFLMNAPAGGIEVWATAQVAGHTAILHSPLGASAWQTALARTADPSVLSATETGQRVVAVLAAGGVTCSDDNGVTWARGCSGAR